MCVSLKWIITVYVTLTYRHINRYGVDIMCPVVKQSMKGEMKKENKTQMPYGRELSGIAYDVLAMKDKIAKWQFGNWHYYRWHNIVVMDDGQPNIHLVNWKEASKVLTETHQQFLGIKHLFINIFHCQGPLPRTFSDTWQLVWEQRVLVIVMTTRTVERHRTKCGQYWPELEGGWQFPWMKY